RTVRTQAEEAPTTVGNVEPLGEITFHLGRTHPAYEVLGERPAPDYEPPYAWYLRVPDVPAFLRHIAPVLEERLQRSILTGHTGELKIDLYRSGLRLEFAGGKLVAAEPWRAPVDSEEAHAGCPPLTFLQLLFGDRSLAELRATFPDVWADSEPSVLINILFPKAPSTVFSLDNT
ncbi:MAG TPA: hypothetical protein PKE45_21490, partial [Caldilineaceae bacterium]|nr:hypothetical protein [Caldilineaceae bacterium]